MCCQYRVIGPLNELLGFRQRVATVSFWLRHFLHSKGIQLRTSSTKRRKKNLLKCQETSEISNNLNNIRKHKENQYGTCRGIGCERNIKESLDLETMKRGTSDGRYVGICHWQSLRRVNLANTVGIPRVCGHLFDWLSRCYSETDTRRIVPISVSGRWNGQRGRSLRVLLLWII